MHVHLDHENCLKKWRSWNAAAVRDFSKAVIAERSVKYGQVSFVPVEMESEASTLMRTTAPLTPTRTRIRRTEASGSLFLAAAAGRVRPSGFARSSGLDRTRVATVCNQGGRRAKAKGGRMSKRRRPAGWGAKQNSHSALDNDISFRHIARTIYRSIDMSTFHEVPMSSVRLPSNTPAISPPRATVPPPGAIAATDLARRCRSSCSPSPARSGSRRRSASPRSDCGRGGPGTKRRPRPLWRSRRALARIRRTRAFALRRPRRRPAIRFSTSAARNVARDPGEAEAYADFERRQNKSRDREAFDRFMADRKTARAPSATSRNRPTRFERTPTSVAPRFLPRGATGYRAGEAPFGRRFAAEDMTRTLPPFEPANGALLRARRFPAGRSCSTAAAATWICPMVSCPR